MEIDPCDLPSFLVWLDGLDCVAQLSHEIIEFFAVLPSLRFPFVFAHHKRPLADALDFQTRALDHDATVGVAEPLQVEALRTRLWIMYCTATFRFVDGGFP